MTCKFKSKKYIVLLGVILVLLLSFGIGIYKFSKADKRNSKFEVTLSPKKYTPAMSSTPGIHIVLNYVGNAEKVRYSTDNGILFRWTDMGGREKVFELPINTAIYWSPIASDGDSSTEKDSVVTISILDKNDKVIDERKVTIKYDNYMYSPQ